MTVRAIIALDRYESYPMSPSSVRMLLKSGYRHVYISRNFAKHHGFIPDDATPGMYGYTGLISIGEPEAP